MALSDDDLAEIRAAGLAGTDQMMAAAFDGPEIVEAWIALDSAIGQVDGALAARGLHAVNRVSGITAFVASNVLGRALGDAGKPAG
jgi:hypothetical protein